MTTSTSTSKPTPTTSMILRGKFFFLFSVLTFLLHHHPTYLLVPVNASFITHTKDLSTVGTIKTKGILSASKLPFLPSLPSPSSSSYSDNWLLDFHNYAQHEKQELTTNAMALLEQQQQQQQQSQQEQHHSTEEWIDSFNRNGFADFCPPMTQGLQCLTIGSDLPQGQQYHPHNNDVDDEGVYVKQGGIALPWDEDEAASIVSIPLTTNSKTTTSSSSSPATLSAHSHPASVYDCILDRGLMESIFSVVKAEARGATTTTTAAKTNTNTNTAETTSTPSTFQDVEQLLLEAATALREHGIYVLITTHEIDDVTRKLLEDASQVAGLQWQFHLDGISDDGSNNNNMDSLLKGASQGVNPQQRQEQQQNKKQFVSIARRYCTGAMPPVGRLSRYYDVSSNDKKTNKGKNAKLP